MTDQEPGKAVKGLTDQLPTEQLKNELQELMKALAQRGMSAATGKLGSVAQKVPSLAQGAGKKVVGAVTDSAGGAAGITKKVAGAGVDSVKESITGGGNGDGDGGGGGKGGQKGKVTNIVEEIDVGVPVRVAYNQWTQFADFPGFMKKVENVEQKSDVEVTWRAKILWSHRDWKSTIIEQIPDERIVWRSEGAKGYVNGAISFHELSSTLTKILVTLEYFPNGLFEKVGNIWRAQGRRARLELKQFRRHVMTETALHQDEVEGWRGEIRDGEVVKEHEEALQEEQEQDQPDQEEEEQPEEEEAQEDQDSEPEQQDRPKPKKRRNQDQPQRTKRRRSGEGGESGNRKKRES